MWLKTIRLENKNVTFKLDTGAEVSVISEELASSLKVKLEKAKKILNGLAGQTLDVIGQFNRKLSHGSQIIQETIYVVKSLHTKSIGITSDYSFGPG